VVLIRLEPTGSDRSHVVHFPVPANLSTRLPRCNGGRRCGIDESGLAAYEQFVRSRTVGLLRRARMLTGDWASAEDLVQVVLAKAWKRWPRVSELESPDAYVQRTLFTTFVSSRRRRWASEAPLENFPDVEVGSHEAVADTLAVVRSALASLPPKQRAVIVLRFQLDLSEADTARVLGCSVGTVKSQTSSALAKLRRHRQLVDLVNQGISS
jgi:RNA polymerase sigma-70 factor (sigma-E family)